MNEQAKVVELGEYLPSGHEPVWLLLSFGLVGEQDQVDGELARLGWCEVTGVGWAEQFGHDGFPCSWTLGT